MQNGSSLFSSCRCPAQDHLEGVPSVPGPARDLTESLTPSQSESCPIGPIQESRLPTSTIWSSDDPMTQARIVIGTSEAP